MRKIVLARKNGVWLVDSFPEDQAVTIFSTINSHKDDKDVVRIILANIVADYSQEWVDHEK